MTLPYEDERIILPMVRMVRDKVTRLTREDVTCRQFGIMRYEYCSKLMADQWAFGRLSETDVRLPDFDKEIYELRAIVDQKGLSDFYAITHDLTFGRKREQRVEYVNYGYDIPPIGVTNSFAYHSPTAAWMVLHPKAPALLIRPEDEIGEAVMQWLTHWSEVRSLYREWPAQRGNEDIVFSKCDIPVSTLSMIKLSKQHSRRPVRRFQQNRY